MLSKIKSQITQFMITLAFALALFSVYALWLSEARIQEMDFKLIEMREGIAKIEQTSEADRLAIVTQLNDIQSSIHKLNQFDILVRRDCDADKADPFAQFFLARDRQKTLVQSD